MFEKFQKQTLVLNNQPWISEVRSIVLSGLTDPQRQSSELELTLSATMCSGWKIHLTILAGTCSVNLQFHVWHWKVAIMTKRYLVKTAHNYKLYTWKISEWIRFCLSNCANFSFYKGSWKFIEGGQKHALNISLISFVTICSSILTPCYHWVCCLW